MTLGGTILGAGAGMYGCLSLLDSETEGALLVGDDGVRIPLDSPMNLGLSSQLEAVWPPGGVIAGLSKVLLEMIVCGSGFSRLFSVIMIGFMRVGGAVCWTGSILGGGT